MKVKSVFEKYVPEFKDVNGNIFFSDPSLWINRDEIACSVPKYLTTKMFEDKFVEDIMGIYHLVSNILWVHWHLVESLECYHKEDNGFAPRVVYSENNLKEIIIEEISRKKFEVN